MFLSPWRKLFLLFLFVSIFLAVHTAVGLARSPEEPSEGSAADSSITICLDNSFNHPHTVSFSGDLGAFTLSGLYPAACHTAGSLDPEPYTINENLPAGYFGQAVNCRSMAGSGASQWQTTVQSASIDLAADSEVECIFYSLPNPDEPNDTMAQATPTIYGGKVTAAIGPHPDAGPDGDIDFYRFYGYAGDTIFIDGDVYALASLANPPWLYLRDKSGSIIAQETNYGSVFLYLEHQLPQNGDYYLEMRVSCVDSSYPCTGEYGWNMSIIDPYEPNDSPVTAAPIEVGDVLRGNINNDDGDPLSPKDHDYYRLQGSAGEEVIIDVSRFDDEQQLGCELLDAAEALLAQDAGSGCYIEHTLPAGGDYFIHVFYKQAPTRLNVVASGYWYGPWNGPYSLSLALKNETPVANPDSYEVLAAEELAVAAPGVLDNDTDADGDPLTAVLTTDILHGDLDLMSDGSFTYKPDSGYIGDDSFQYHAFDGRDPSPPITVTITIKPQTVYLPISLSG